jgi:hypothetical protein
MSLRRWFHFTAVILALSWPDHRRDNFGTNFRTSETMGQDYDRRLAATIISSTITDSSKAAVILTQFQWLIVFPRVQEH